MGKIDFFIAPTDDVWTRDTGPIFVYDNDKNLKILDPGFNGWGKHHIRKMLVFVRILVNS